MTAQTLSYRPYIRRFVLCYIGLTIVLAAVDLFTTIDFPTGVSLIINFAAAMAVGKKFTENIGRTPYKQEKKRLALYVLLAVLTLIALYLAVVFSILGPDEVSPGISDISPVAVLMIIVVTGLVSYGISILGLSLGIKIALKRQEKNPPVSSYKTRSKDINMTEGAIPYGPFIRRFLIYYISCISALTVIDVFTDIDVPSSMSVLIIMFAAMGTGVTFAKKTGRLPDETEKRQLCLNLLFVVFTIWFVFVGLAFLLGQEVLPGITTLSPTSGLVIIVFTGLLSYALLVFGIDWGAKNITTKTKEKYHR